MGEVVVALRADAAVPADDAVTEVVAAPALPDVAVPVPVVVAEVVAGPANFVQKSSAPTFPVNSALCTFGCALSPNAKHELAASSHGPGAYVPAEL